MRNPSRCGYSIPNPTFDRLRALLDAGADVKARGPDGDTLLTRAVAVSSVETAALLIEKGANANKTGKDGKSPKELAEERGDPKMVALLQKVGG
jgi:ankyrin repeat protein